MYFVIYGIQTKKSVLPIILILHRLVSQIVKCPSSQGQNKRMRFLNMSATPFGTALQRYGNYLENVQ